MGFCGSGDFHVIRQCWSAIRVGQVSCGVKSTTAQHININKPTTTFGAAGLKTPAVGEKPPTHVTPFQNRTKMSEIPPAHCTHLALQGQISHMIIAWDIHSRWRASACACIRHPKLLPLELRRPPGNGPDQKQRFYMAALINHQ